MGGKVSVKSKEGSGTTFKIELTTICKIPNFKSSDKKIDMHLNSSGQRLIKNS